MLNRLTRSLSFRLLLIFLVLGLCRIRRSWVAVSLVLIVIAWGLPLREEMMKWPRIVIWPYPSLDLKMSDNVIELLTKSDTKKNFALQRLTHRVVDKIHTHQDN